jgi:hypothetical protein
MVPYVRVDDSGLDKRPCCSYLQKATPTVGSAGMGTGGRERVVCTVAEEVLCRTRKRRRPRPWQWYSRRGCEGRERKQVAMCSSQQGKRGRLQRVLKSVGWRAERRRK